MSRRATLVLGPCQIKQRLSVEKERARTTPRPARRRGQSSIGPVTEFRPKTRVFATARAGNMAVLTHG